MVIWFAIALFMTSRHVMWRDEVRALSLAIDGRDTGEMLIGLRGEGHPALWYLILRGAYSLYPHPQALAAVALLIGTTWMAILALRAPFRPLAIALVMFSGFGLYEYTIMARNYGIAALLLCVLAASYRRARGGTAILPLLLFLLCSSNVHGILLAGGMFLFCYADKAGEGGWIAALRDHGLIVSGMAILLGVGACYWEVSFPLQDAVQTLPVPGFAERLERFAGWLLLPGLPFNALEPRIPSAILSILLWLSLAGLAFRPGLLAAGLSVQVGMTALFVFVYPGGYRHAALYCALLITLYWLGAQGFGGHWPVSSSKFAEMFARWQKIGCAAMLALLTIQAPRSAEAMFDLVRGRVESSAAAMGQLLSRPDLRNAIVLGDPDFHLETLVYYAANPTYFVREARYGRVVHFTRKARLNISLEDVLNAARSQARRHSRPVVILLENPVETVTAPVVWKKGYVWTLSVTPQQKRAFLSATVRLQSFAGASTDENYTAYLLRTPDW
jgi:hypothetical protein